MVTYSCLVGGKTKYFFLEILKLFRWGLADIKAVHIYLFKAPLFSKDTMKKSRRKLTCSQKLKQSKFFGFSNYSGIKIRDELQELP